MDSLTKSVLNKGIHSKLLYTSSQGPILASGDAQANRESRFFPLDTYPFSGDLNIIGDYVVLLDLSENQRLGIQIRSAEIASAMRVVFRMLWDGTSTSPENQ